MTMDAGACNAGVNHGETLMSAAMFCLHPARRFAAIGAAFVLIGLQTPGFLPAGLVFLLLSVRQRYQHGRC